MSSKPSWVTKKRQQIKLKAFKLNDLRAFVFVIANKFD